MQICKEIKKCKKHKTYKKMNLKFGRRYRSSSILVFGPNIERCNKSFFARNISNYSQVIAYKDYIRNKILNRGRLLRRFVTFFIQISTSKRVNTLCNIVVLPLNPVKAE